MTTTTINNKLERDTHQPKKAGNTILRSASYALSMSDHAGTHVDVPKHFDPSPGALSIDKMPIEDFYTEAICLDLSYVELKATISVKEMEDALTASGQEIKQGDTVLIYMAFNKRIPFDDPRWQHDFPGLSLEAVHWLADKGSRIFGVEAISPAPEGEPNFQAHNACGKRGITHIEGLDHLEKVVGQRFRFIGFPLRIRDGSGGPMRAVALLERALQSYRPRPLPSPLQRYSRRTCFRRCCSIFDNGVPYRISFNVNSSSFRIFRKYSVW